MWLFSGAFRVVDELCLRLHFIEAKTQTSQMISKCKRGRSKHSDARNSTEH